MHWGHSCLINLLCQEAGVPEEPTDVILKSQIPISDSTLARLEKRGPRAVPQEAHRQQQPQAPPEAEHPPLYPALADFIYGSANWMDEASSQLYIEPPRFSKQFSELALQHRRKPSHSYQRFGSREKMRGYFQATRERAVRLEQEIEEDYDYGESIELAELVGGATDPHGFNIDDQDQQED